MKKVIAFDLDGTLAPSKSPIPDAMAESLAELLGYYHVCVLSGGRFEQFQKQLLSNFDATPDRLERMHFMPTCGTRYYTYEVTDHAWKLVYAEDFTTEEKQKIIHELEKAVDELGFREKKTYGEAIEDRDSQITFSALGQKIVEELGEEGLHMKESWDPDHVKKNALRDYLAPKLPEFEVRVGGISSVDITKPGIDKAYGMRKFMEMMGFGKDEILFIGDRLYEGGNDYPIKAMGIDSIEISDWRSTAAAVNAIVHLTR